MTQYLTLNQPKQQTAVAPFSPTGTAVVSLTKPSQPAPLETWPLKCVVAASPVITIPAPVYFSHHSPLAMLAGFLAIGRTYHQRAQPGSFVDRVEMGYFAYERRTEWRTCAVAAAYAGAFGMATVEQGTFSYSQATWELSDLVGHDLSQLYVLGPTGRVSAVMDEIVLLSDVNLWTRLGIVHWLPKAQIVQQAQVMS